MILCIVQARVSSSRLPGKVLKPILGKPMIVHELERLKRSKRIDKIVLATSQDESDDGLAGIVVNNGFEIYRGSLEDVLDRYYQCAKQYRPEHVVRITGDCPVIDWQIVDTVIEKHLKEGNDYTVTTDRFPDGLDTEVFRFYALERAWKEAMLPSEREHVTQYFRKHAEIFKSGQMDCKNNFEAMRWTVDESRDFEFIQQVYEELYPGNMDFAMNDILELLVKRPQLQFINDGIIRNEGLQISLQKEKTIGGWTR